MGSLPASRVNVSRYRCRLRRAAPVTRGKARNHKISLFVCFATKAVHLELVSDLMSEAFIAAFKRFISRRDRTVHIYSDNGITFVGAHRQIQELYDIYNDQQLQFEIKEINFLRELEISSRLMHPILEVYERQP